RNLEIDTTNIGFNDASDSGGAIFLDTAGMSTVSVRNSSVYVNEAVVDGGGLKSVGNEIVEIVNSTFSLNEAEADGGGLYLSSSLTGAQVYSSTITLNKADSAAAVNNGSGGGIYVESGAGLVYFRNTILADNDDLSTSPTSFYGPDCYADIASEGYNLIGYANYWCDLSGGPGDLVGDGASGAIDPVLGTLMQNTGWPTMAHPLLGGPAIDAADPAGCYDVDGSFLVSDQVGRPRPHGGRGDIGAFETGPPVHLFSDGFESGGAWYWSEVVGQ
ncbi:MAG: choice-of-anchor Q domain-containing protein, partial [Acidobacteriota bacterium]